MSLLSLPFELLYQILRDVEFDSVDDPFPHNRRTKTIRSVGATCKLLRSLSIRYVYETLRVTCLRDLEALPTIFASHQDIAASVRSLAFGFPGGSVLVANRTPSKDVALTSINRYRQILRDCKNIRTLYIEAGEKHTTECRLDSYGLHSDGMSALLEHINPEAAPRVDRLIVKRFNLKKMFSHFRVLGSLSNLSTLWLIKCDGSLGNPLVCWKSGLKLFPSLPSVRDFRFQLKLPGLSEESERMLGEHIALMIPNVTTLALDTSTHCVLGALTIYAKTSSSNIKELQLGLPPTPYPHSHPSNPPGIHLCDSIAILSSKLTNFQACLGSNRYVSTLPICHKMFAGKWPHLQELWYSGYASVCNGIDRDQLHENLARIAAARTEAMLDVCCGMRLLYKAPENSAYYLADMEAFFDFGIELEGSEASDLVQWIGEIDTDGYETDEDETEVEEDEVDEDDVRDSDWESLCSE